MKAPGYLHELAAQTHAQAGPVRDPLHMHIIISILLAAIFMSVSFLKNMGR